MIMAFPRRCGLFIILILALSLLPSCSSGEKESGEERVDISIAYWYSYSPAEDDELKRFIEDKLGITIHYENVSGYDWDVEYNRMFSSGEIPDIFISDYLGYGAYSDLISRGLVRPVPSDLEAYPSLREHMEDPYFDYFRDDEGIMYCIPRIGFEDEYMWGLNRVFLVRKDWMERLSIGMPSSYDEFRAMLEAFRDGDPDGNGLDDTIALDIENANKIEALYLGIDPCFSNIERGWIYENGCWMPVWCSERMGDILWYFDDLYESGLLNPDFAYMSDIQAIADFMTGRTGCLAYPYFQLLKLYGEDEEFFSDSVAIMHPWAVDGTEYRFTTVNHWSEIYISGAIGDEKAERIYALLDYLLSDEFDEDVGENGFYSCRSYKFFAELVIYDISKYYREGYVARSPELRNYIDSEIAWSRDVAEPVAYDWSVTFMDTPSKSRLPSNLEVHEAIVRAVLSKEDVGKAWDAELQRLRASYPVDEAIAEVTAMKNAEDMDRIQLSDVQDL